MQPNWAVYITEDPKFMGNGNVNNNIIFAMSRDIDIINRSNDTYLLFYRDDTDVNNRLIFGLQLIQEYLIYFLMIPEE